MIESRWFSAAAVARYIPGVKLCVLILDSIVLGHSNSSIIFPVRSVIFTTTFESVMGFLSTNSQVSCEQKNFQFFAVFELIFNDGSINTSMITGR